MIPFRFFIYDAKSFSKPEYYDDKISKLNKELNLISYGAVQYFNSNLISIKF